MNMMVDKMDKKNEKPIDKEDSNARSHEDVAPAIFEYVLTKYSLRQGLAKFGD